MGFFYIFVSMWTTKETTREYKGITITKYEGSKVKESFKNRDPRTIQKDDNRFTKWYLYETIVNGVKYNSEKLRYVKDFIDTQTK